MGIMDDMGDLYPEMQARPEDLAAKKHAAAMGPPDTPEGTVWVPEMGSFVDADVAAQLGIEGRKSPETTHELTGATEQPEGNQRVSEGAPEELPEEDGTNPEDSEEEADFDTESETLADMINAADAGKVDAAFESIMEGDFETTLGTVSEALGVDQQGASSLIELAVEEAKPNVAYEIGEAAFDSLVYAATSTPDPMARKVLTDLVSGKIPRGRYEDAYALWYQSLPDAD